MLDARRWVAVLQRVAGAASDAQLDAAIAATDLGTMVCASRQQQLLQQHAPQLEQHRFGAALAAALARCLRAVSATPVVAAAPARDSRHRELLTFTSGLVEMLNGFHQILRSAPGGRVGLLQQVCSTELPDALPAACARLTAQLAMPAPQPQQQQQQQVVLDSMDITLTAEWYQLVWGTAALLVLVHSALAGLAATRQQADARDRAAAAKMPAAGTLAALAPMVTALLQSHQQCRDSLAAAAASSSASHHRQAAREDQAAFRETTFKPSMVLGAICFLMRAATDNGDAPEDAVQAVIAAAPELPFLAAAGLAGVAAAAHQASGGMSKFPLPGAACPSSTAASSSSRRAGRAAGSSRSQRQGSAVPAFHSELLAALGVPSLEAAFAPADVPPGAASNIIGAGFCVLRDLPATTGLSSSSGSSDGGSGSTQLSAASLRLLCAVLAELSVLDDGPHEQNLCIRLMSSTSIAANRMQRATDLASVGDAGTLSLLLTLVLPAALHATATAEEKSITAQDASSSVRTACMLTSATLPKGQGCSVFDSQLFTQHSAAVLSGLEAAVRHEACHRLTHDSWKDRAPFAVDVLAQADFSAGLCGWLREAVSVQAAGSGSAAREAGANCSRLLGLLVTCTKGVLAYVQHQKQLGGPAQLAGHFGNLLLTLAVTSSLVEAAMEGAASGSANSVLLDGWGHLLGRSLAAIGSLLACALSASATAVLADGWGRLLGRVVTAAGGLLAGTLSPCADLFQFFLVLTKWLQTHLPALSTPGYSQQQLLEPLEALAAAAAAVQALWDARKARAAAVVAAASRGEAGNIKAEQLWLLRLNPAAGQQLSGSLAAMGGVLCAALPTRHACNDPACTSCDKASEQQLVSGKASKCSACRVARYCCVEHQHAHWRAHRPACKALAAAAAAASGGDGQASSSSSKKEKRGKAGGGGGGSSSSSRRGG